MRKLLVGTLLILSVTEAGADFYRYQGNDGVETFTNTPTRSAERVLKEKPAPRSREGRQGDATGGGSRILPVHGNITSNVGWRHDPIDGGLKHHNGVDIAVPSGTPVKAITDGTVTFSGVRGGYGNLVVVEHDGGLATLYGHNSQLMVKAGDRVGAGETLALSGASGRCTGPHLHFELWKNGVNTTREYLAGTTGLPEAAGSIRSYLHADGSIVFTNY
ncbi:M23 family metallopeptidase [Geomonas sp. RF6]|uniref:M23 family metallopeptidase n=1 Tax=Geomonas sp. RF6 TaxID=2897342 RepID=UPI001E2D3CB9|nr:M23 family metallopeptidase [Geomonas sp. RF6]UFS69275.1 M23 family metallopeptidase [Geomonas sp. RF6]